MRKLFCLILGGLLLSVGFASCDDEPDNPGDYSIRGTIGLTGITSVLGNEYELIVSREFDSTIVRYNLKYDTTFADDGTTVVEIKEDTLWYEDGVCHYVKMEQIDLSPDRDTLAISIVSNARWTAPAPSGGTPNWFTPQEGGGGGDGTLHAVVSRNGSANPRRNLKVQQIITSDSATIYEIPFMQLGRTN